MCEHPSGCKRVSKMITVIGKPVGCGIPIATPVATVINMRLPSQFKEPRRIGGGEIGSEPIDFGGISLSINKKDRRDSYALWSLLWIERHESDIFFEPNHTRYKTILYSISQPNKWKRKNMVGYYKWDIFGNLNFSDWDIVSSEEDIVVGRKLC